MPTSPRVSVPQQRSRQALSSPDGNHGHQRQHVYHHEAEEQDSSLSKSGPNPVLSIQSHQHYPYPYPYQYPSARPVYPTRVPTPIAVSSSWSMVWEWGNPSHTHTSLGFFSFLLIQPKNLRESILSDPINGPSAPSLNRLSVLLKKAFSVHMHPFFFFCFPPPLFLPPYLTILTFRFSLFAEYFCFLFFFFFWLSTYPVSFSALI